MENVRSGDLDRFEWQRPLREALLEIHPEQLKGKVAEAETAIFERLQALARGTDNAEERQALQDGSNTLRVLKRDVLKFPDWRPE